MVVMLIVNDRPPLSVRCHVRMFPTSNSIGSVAAAIIFIAGIRGGWEYWCCHHRANYQKTDGAR